MALKHHLIRAADRLSGFTPAPILARLEESQFWSVDQLQQLQARHLRAVLFHAGEYVPFYRDLFRSLKFNARDVRSVADIECLPILTKAQIMENPSRFVSSAAPLPRVMLQTSGSTGIPLRFVRTRIAQSYKIASRLRYRRWYNIERGDPQLILSGSPRPPDTLLARLKHGLHQYSTGRTELFSAELQEDRLFPAYRLIEERGITSIIGFPTGLMHLADFFVRSGQRPRSLIAVFSSGETLYDWMRQRIEKGFGISPRNDYVATEGAIAQECPEGGLHVNMEECLVELVPIKGSPVFGKVIVSFLHTLDFPLIRYEIGDVARWDVSPCPCGRGLTKIDSAFGRYKDGIQLPDGRYVTAAEIYLRLSSLPFMKNVPLHQIAQLDAHSAELRVLDGPSRNEAAVERLAPAIQEILRPLTVSTRLCKELPREKNGGKFRAVIPLSALAASDTKRATSLV